MQGAGENLKSCTEEVYAQIVITTLLSLISYKNMIYWQNNKYYNKTIVVDGIAFQSKKEANRWLELRLLERSGEITDLRRQVKFELIPTQREPDTIGKRGGVIKGKIIEHGVSYVADFVYKDKQGNMVVEDTKGMRTKEYVIKRKLMKYVHGVRIKEV